MIASHDVDVWFEAMAWITTSTALASLVTHNYFLSKRLRRHEDLLLRLAQQHVDHLVGQHDAEMPSPKKPTLRPV